MDANYKILGGDGDEYGPATLDELKGWIREGRVAGMTRVWRSDLGMWSPANRYTELHEELARLHASAASAATAAAWASARPCGFWMRFYAFLLDRFLLCAIFFMIYTPVAQWQHWSMPEMPRVITDKSTQQFTQEFTNWWANEGGLIFYPLFILYDVMLNGCFGATLGKMAIGARITRVDGSPIGYNRALLRWLAARLSDLTLGLGYLLIAARGDKRALHDLLAGTKVVYRR
jgi:uncharacterized RDD family membrane protein YckC